ncbi:hypothetical protein R1flu_018279 [Riccia fluitans]|uniref:Uncharacterized protein n=1 Tax=Riccia fluitans TaxID=41844 RepID=A0ABD1ZHM9_9MARC
MEALAVRTSTPVPAAVWGTSVTSSSSMASSSVQFCLRPWKVATAGFRGGEICGQKKFVARTSGQDTNVRFPRYLHQDFKLVGRRSAGKFLCHAEGKESSSCCGGSGGGGGGGKCSSHTTDPALAGVGKEFEALVASKMMREFEEGYETGQLEGTISRDVVKDVVNILPEALDKSSEERFIDVDQLLAEATAMSRGDFVFDSEFEDMMV